MKKFFLEYKYLFLVTTLSLIINFRWLSFSIFQKSDWNFLFSVQSSELFSSSIWLGNKTLGLVDLTFWKFPVYLLYSLFGKIGLDSNITDFFVVFIPIILLLPIASYFVSRKIVGSDFGGFIAAIVVSFNTYFLAISTQGHIMINASSVFCIFSILFFMYSLEYLDKWYLLFFSILSLFVSTFYDLRISYITIFVIVLYFIFHLFYLEDKTFQKIFKHIVFFSCLLLIFILLSLYWFLPQLISGSVSNNSVLDRPLFGNQYWNIEAAFNLFHPFWSGGQVNWFMMQKMPSYFWLIPIFAFIGLMVNRKNKNVIFFGAVSLLGIFLTKQIDKPFPDFYVWMYSRFPGFNAFREASKFYFLILIGYSVLISSFVEWLFSIKMLTKTKIFTKYLLVIVVLIIFFWNTKPILTGEISTMFVARKIPNDYIVLKDFLINNNDYFRIMWLPRDSRWSIYTNKNPKISDVEAISSTYSSLLANDNELPIENQVINLFKNSFSKSILDISTVKYVIIPIQDKNNDDDFFIDYGGKKKADIRQWYIDQLDKITWLEKKDIGTKDLVVYENKNYKESIFSFSKLYSLNSLQNLDNKYNFTSEIGNSFYFISRSTDEVTKNLTKVSALFENTLIDRNNISDDIDIESNKNELFTNLDDNNIYLNNKIVLGGVLQMNQGINSFEYKNPKFKFENIINNPSFEDGAWQEKVGDCNNFDNNPVLGMSLDKTEKTDGNQSIQLEATRHVACIVKKNPVNAGSKYSFSFDYQSSNSSVARYYIEFSGKTKSSMSENIPIKNSKWNTYNVTFTAPADAESINLYVYANSVDNKTKIINLYDNFKLIEIPDLSNAYYLVSGPETKLAEPKSISFDLINPTKKLVHIKGATTPFYLAMSESYHPKWQLQFNNNKVNGLLNSWAPFVSPDKIQEGYHYKLNDFLNAWYVDTDQYCKNNNLCTKNADGSYDMEMVIEFFPQRWFYLGLLISGATLVGCVGYLGCEGVKSIRRRRKNKYEKDN